MPSLAEPVVERLLIEFKAGLKSLEEMDVQNDLTEDSVRDLVMDFCFCSRLIRTDLRTVRGAKRKLLAEQAVQMFVEAADQLNFLTLIPDCSLTVYVNNIRLRAVQVCDEFNVAMPALILSDGKSCVSP